MSFPTLKRDVNKCSSGRRAVAWYFYKMVARNMLRTYDVKSSFPKEKSDLTMLLM